jgi:hypothetical protein
MDEALQAHLTTLRQEVQTAALPEAAQQTILWCLRQLPALYTKFRLSSESRYGDEIARLVQGMVKGLVECRPVCPEAQQLAADIPQRLQVLHEQAGLPDLHLKAPRAASSRSRKVG